MRISVLLVLTVLAACSSDDGGPEPAFPAEYLATYLEVRDCRFSSEHDGRMIRILADPEAFGPYAMRDAPFPDGAVVLKEEFDGGCDSPVTEWTVMVKNSAATDTIGWDWQRVAADRTVRDVPVNRCIGCHSLCDAAADGYDFACACDEPGCIPNSP